MLLALRFALITILLDVTVTLHSHGQNINARVYSDVVLQAFNFSVIQGKYEVIANERIQVSLDVGDSIYVSKADGMLVVKHRGKTICEFRFLHVRGVKSANVMLLAPSRPFVKQRVYDDDLYVDAMGEGIKLINDVNFERYIAGVIESEGGHLATPEYYKVQAILCRTYAMKYFEKHLSDGYNLCDRVHCQAYYGKCTKNIDIVKATQETSGMVIVDSSLSIISATFFSNSGGETVNSEDMWQKPIPYLRSVKDSFSLGQPNTSWEKTIPMIDWNKYLASKGFAVNDSLSDSAYCKVPMRCRPKAFTMGKRSIFYKDIRKDLNLKSAFFDVIKHGDTIVLKGKGYGHGVGLAQEGAMNMARQGYTYDQIIKFYYTNVIIMSVKNIEFFKVE